MSPAASIDLARPELLALALHGEDDEVAAVGDHAREHGLADQRRARRDHDLGHARTRRVSSVAASTSRRGSYWLGERARVVG